MFSHTVLLKLGPSFDESRLAEFESLADAVLKRDGVHHYALVPNEARSAGGYNYFLFSTFADRASFDAYDRDELHDRIKAFLAPFVEALVVADGEVLARGQPR